MSENPIGVWKSPHSLWRWYWQHPDCDLGLSWGSEVTAAKAADAGREHMRRFHGYSRRCGVSLAACGAQTCRCVSVDPGSEKGPENAVQGFDLSHDCATCGMSSADCDRHVFGCCSACNATGGCIHENPMQATYDTTRRDA